MSPPGKGVEREEQDSLHKGEAVGCTAFKVGYLGSRVYCRVPQKQKHARTLD